jgi:hypothetical protein
VQTDVTLRDRFAAARIHSMRRSSSSARRVPVPPATISVSIGKRQALRVRSGASATVDVRSGPSSGATTVTS